MKHTHVIVPLLGASVLAGGLVFSAWRVSTSRPARAGYTSQAADNVLPSTQARPERLLAPRKDFKQSGHPFFDQLHWVEDKFEALTADEMVRNSVMVIRGTIEEITDGRTIDFARGPSHPEDTALLKVSVQKVLHGSSGGSSHVYVEVVRAPFIRPAALNATKPNQEMTLFLRKAYTNTEVHTYIGGTLPAGEELYALTNPQGMLLDTEQGLFTQPLSEEPIFPPDVDTVDEVEEMISGRPSRSADY